MPLFYIPTVPVALGCFKIITTAVGFVSSCFHHSEGVSFWTGKMDRVFFRT